MAADKRKEGESFAEYKARLRDSEIATKAYLKGRVVYSPYRDNSKSVPFVKEKNHA